MAKPRLIILVRHAQSEGNKNREIHQTIPDHRVKLTQEGWQQAYDAGRRLRKMLRADDTLHFFTSPYRRTRETTEGMLATLTADDEGEGPSPFKRSSIKVYEEPRLREQDFGNFQPCSAEMERMWQERADYGHFFYRIPNGESAADAYDRVSGFNESLWRQFGDDDFASVCVLVTHGLMSRVFLMKWYHFSVEYFEDLRNVNHCEFLIMHKQDESGKYILENKLRTWSELRRERAQLLKDKEDKGNKDGNKDAIKDANKDTSSKHGNKDGNDTNGNGNGNGNGCTAKDGSKLDKAVASTSSPILPRRWGGCPNGCSHDKNFKIRSALADLVRRDGTANYSNTVNSPTTSTSKLVAEEVGASVGSVPSTNGTSSPNLATSTHSHMPGHISSCSLSSSSSSLANRRPAARRYQSTEDDSAADSMATPPQIEIDVSLAQEETVSSPDGTPSFISVEDRLRAQLKSPHQPPMPRLVHVGRDFGGTYSGHTSDNDSSEDDSSRNRMARLKAGVGGVPALETNGLQNGNKGLASPTVGNEKGNGNGTLNGGGNGHKRDQSRMGRRTMANRLGDASHCDHPHHHHSSDEADHSNSEHAQEMEDEEEEDEDLAQAEKENKSIRGSVY